ncbi:MAG: hypothetical protein WDW38_008026 [Sanguina aurantia]
MSMTTKLAHEVCEKLEIPPETQTVEVQRVPLSVDTLTAQASPAVLRPLGFLVSWQGVLALAYTGWPPSLLHLKQQLNSAFASLPKESPGSLWPKTSLGALKEGARLTPQQLDTLTSICKDVSSAFQSVTRPGDGETDSHIVLVDSLSMVTFECRCLERQLSSKLMMLADREPDLSAPSNTESARVQTILKEPEAPGYWFHASRDGGRESHYRGNALGVTLAHTLPFFQPAMSSLSHQAATVSPPRHIIADAITTLKSAIEGDPELAGLYAWFEPTSLHVTLRGILG